MSQQPELITDWDYKCPDCGWTFKAPITLDARDEASIDAVIEHGETAHPDPKVH